MVISTLAIFGQYKGRIDNQMTEKDENVVRIQEGNNENGKQYHSPKEAPGIDCPKECKFTSQVLENILLQGVKVEMGFDDYKQYDLNKYSLALSAVVLLGPTAEVKYKSFPCPTSCLHLFAGFYTCLIFCQWYYRA